MQSTREQRTAGHQEYGQHSLGRCCPLTIEVGHDADFRGPEEVSRHLSAGSL